MKSKKLATQVIGLVLVVLCSVACGVLQPSPTTVPPTATPIPPTDTPISPTATPAPTPWPITALIKLSKAQWDEPGKPLRLQVIEGKYKLVSGAELWAGSDTDVSEDWLTFPEGLAIDIGDDGIRLKGKVYSQGTRLRVDATGQLIETE